MSKASKIKSFDPNSPGSPDAGIYGLPFTTAEADIVLVPVPWEVTTSYGGGTSHGPQAIFDASFQVDLFNPEFPALWKRGIAMDEIPKALLEQSKALKKEAQQVIAVLIEGGDAKQKAKAKKALERINAECAVMNDWVEQRTGYWMEQGKLVGLVGGDHSTPLGFLRAQAKRQITRMLRLDDESVADFHRVDPRWRKSGRAIIAATPAMSPIPMRRWRVRRCFFW